MAVSVEIKFCGLTRAEDALAAGELGAHYVGVVFAEGSVRRLDPSRAAAVLDAAGEQAQRAGIFGTLDVREVSRVARTARLHVAQLHGDPDASQVRAVREVAGVAVWAVIRVHGNALPAHFEELAEAADAVVLDTYTPGRLGGTGVPFDWRAIGRLPLAGVARRVAAGGLTPANVTEALAALAPDVVDVSSGVECEPGIKDHARMRAFVDAVRRWEREP
ncbi:MAG TPA: phosphoribosylanthranilate isomerase [Gemmatimonadaceae bacterium]|nr:phosphoribosylanthranilate isomerase [Gemmatimonadaceae bacterium]